MDQELLDKLKYPIGRFSFYEITPEELKKEIEDLAMLPTKMREAVTGLSPEELDRTYREGGWSIKQIVHHCADSHCNALIRFKWALTEDQPQIKDYRQDLWAKLSDGNDAPIGWSLDLLDALHKKWIWLIRHLSPEELNREFIHPDANKPRKISGEICRYAWHGRHHLAHIKIALRD
jgi:hypothetical protein